jgi:hypothetical protein
VKIVFAGSRTLPLDGDLASHILALLIEYDPAATTVLLRKPTNRPLRAFEALVAGLATALGIRSETREPGPGGRKATFVRDIDLVEAADRVLAFFPAGEEMDGGTGHVVETAQNQAKPVIAYVVENGQVRWLGGLETGEYQP